MKEQRSSSEALLDVAVETARERTAGGLSEIRTRAVLARIKSDVRRAPRRSRAPIFAGVGAGVGLAAAALVTAYLTLGSEGPPLVPSSAEVVFRSAGVRVESGADLLGGDTTRIGGGARLDLDGGARVDLDIRGEARVAVFGPAEVGRAQDGTIGVKQGRASFSVSPHAKDAPFVVRVGSDRIVVHGTKFDVEVEAGRLSRVDVSEGRVEVQRKGEPVRMLKRGERFAARQNAEPIAGAGAASFDAPWWDEERASKGFLFVESDPAGAEVELDGVAIGRAPLLVRWDAGEKRATLALAGRAPWRGPIRIVAGSVARISERLAPIVAERSDETPETPETPELPEVAPRSDPWKNARRLLKKGRCDRLDRVVKQIARSGDREEAARAEMLGAECQLRRGKKELALARYLKIEKQRRDTPSAEAALFEAANLEADLGKRGALARLDRYLELHPQGRFAEAAAIRRCELLVGASRLADARSCLESYRTDHPGGMRASQAALLLATIARIEGRWTEASAAYRDYLTRSPGSRHAETARHHLIECLIRGKLDGVDEAIADFLKQHPDGARAEEVEKWQRARTSSR